MILISVPAFADNLVSPNSVPVFSTIIGDPRYQAAANKAQEAFLLQTGFTPAFNQAQSVAAKAVTNGASNAIDQNTPLSSKALFFVGAASYAVCVKHQVTQKFKDPLFPSVTHTVSAGKNSGSTGIGFSW